MPQQQSYKTFRVNIDTSTLLDDFAPVFIDDIAKQFQPVFKLKEEYCLQLENNCRKLQAFPEFSSLTTNLRQYIKTLQNDFLDCEENVSYFTLVFMGAVSAGKTSMICDFLNVNPDQLNQALQTSQDFQNGCDDVVIAGEVATRNVYEFLVDSSHIRLVDVPGTGGVSHDNTTIAPFVNKADCVIFLSNASSDLTRDDHDFIVRHIVGLQNVNELTDETVSNKKALIIVNKWNTVIEGLPPNKQEQQWQTKQKWILWGNGKEAKGDGFKGLSHLFKRTLTIVPASTSRRILDENNGTYDKYTEAQLGQVIDALKNILLDEGIKIKLERPKLILNDSLSSVEQILSNEKTKQSVDELVNKLEQMGVKVTVDSNSIMLLLNSRLDSLQTRLKNDLFYQIKSGFDRWKPNVRFMERLKGAWPKEWWGSEKFGAKAVQEELKARWQTELKDLLDESIKPDDIKRTVRSEAEAIGQLLEATFKAQLAELQNQLLKDKLARGVSLQPIDAGSFSLTGSSKALEDAVNSAVSEIQQSIVDDIIGIVTVDVVIAALIGAFLTPLGSAMFLAVRRWMKGQSEEEKAKRNIEDEIWVIADAVSKDMEEQVANKVRGSVQKSVNSITQVIEGERQSLSKLLQALDTAIYSVQKIREQLDVLSQ